MTTIHVIGLNQLVKPDLSRSTHAFAKRIISNWALPRCFTCLANVYVTSIYMFDNYILSLFGCSVISNYTLGLINDEHFKKQLCAKLGLKKIGYDDFKADWNAMCQMDEADNAQFKRVVNSCIVKN
jgi:cell division protein FtsL